jgi:anti-sigma factor RsiW
MMNHPAREELERYTDGELAPAEVGEIDHHLQECAACATSALGVVQMKRAIHDMMSEEVASTELRERVRLQIAPQKMSHSLWWTAAAAVVLIFITMAVIRMRSTSAIPELVDMHVTLLASANPVDVISTDRHTVKPWFEGRLPFTVPVPDLAPPFHLIGGRIVYWHSNPTAYLLVGKGAHRISLFVFRDDYAPRDLQQSTDTMSTFVWRSGGLTFVAVGQVPRDDLQTLSASFRGDKGSR